MSDVTVTAHGHDIEIEGGGNYAWLNADAVAALREHFAAERRETLRAAIWPVLVNARNYPEAVQSRILGRDMSPLIDAVLNAALPGTEETR